MTIGPISERLIAELNAAALRSGIVLWLDGNDDYSDWVDRQMAASSSSGARFELQAYRGSFLALMLQLGRLESGTTPTPLVIHLPEMNEDDVRATPLYELYAAGRRFRKAVDTLVTEAATGYVTPQVIDEFLARDGWTLADADAWLAERIAGGEGDAWDWIARLRPIEVYERLAGPRASQEFGAQLVAADSPLWRYCESHLGVQRAWREQISPNESLRLEDVAFVCSSWALAVEYVSDRSTPAVSPLLAGASGLSRPIVEACRQFAADLRARHRADYLQIASETERLLAQEADAARAEDLGKIDTFFFEEQAVFRAAIAAIHSGNSAIVRDWAARRLGSGRGEASFWLRGEPARKAAWDLLQAAERLDRALESATRRSVKALTIEAWVEAYTADGAAVDLAHRELEQLRNAMLGPTLPQFFELRDALDAARARWSDWASTWAHGFNAACSTSGFLPGRSMQQRHLFEEVVRPLLGDTPVALFVVDALRYEMATALQELLPTSRNAPVVLKPRLAELPSITSVGMNVLAPITRNDRLVPELRADLRDFEGFSTGEYRVSNPDTRQRAMHARAGGGSCPLLKLGEVLERDATSLRRSIGQARLLIVHSIEIDKSGESGTGLTTFDTVLRNLASAFSALRDAGVRNFVFTSDHGFLLQPEGARGQVAHGTRRDPARRHVLTRTAEDHPDKVRVSFTELGYEGDGIHVLMPRGLEVFDRGERPSEFVHGGNSLQERVIPVLVVHERTQAGGQSVEFEAECTPAEAVMGMHRIKIRLQPGAAQNSLAFSVPKTVQLLLKAEDAEGVDVELAHAGAPAVVAQGALVAPVGPEFELFFRLHGSRPQRVAVRLEPLQSGVQVRNAATTERFSVAVSAAGRESPPVPSAGQSGSGDRWLNAYEDAGVRQVFAHLHAHGSLTELEAGQMLGGPRAARRFALAFDEHAAKAPFVVRVDTTSGVKRYVREGGAR